MTTEGKKRTLTEIEKALLRKLILDEPSRPTSYKFSDIYRLFSYATHSEDEIKTALQNLAEYNYLVVDKGYYSLTREMFLILKQRYRFHILLNSDYNKVILPVIVGIVGAIISIIPTFKNLDSGQKKNEPTAKDKIELRFEQIETKLSILDTLYIGNTYKSDTARIVKEIIELKSQYLKLSDNVSSLNSLLQDNPTKFIEIATIKRDIDDIKKLVAGNDESLKREVDRISSYNNTLIVFMITFLVAYIGIGVFNVINRNKNSNI